MLSAPVAEEATAVDTMEFAKTICIASKCLLQAKENDCNKLFLQALSLCLKFFTIRNSNTELLTLLSEFFTEFFSSLKLSLLTEDIVQSLTEVHIELLTSLSKEYLSVFIPCLSSFIRLIGESFTSQSERMIQRVLALYDGCTGKQAMYLFICCVDKVAIVPSSLTL